MVGTLAFAAPEAISYRPYSVNSDVWSYGCVLVCAALGLALPFGNGGAEADAPADAAECVGSADKAAPRRHTMPDMLQLVCSGRLTPSLPDAHSLHGLVRASCVFDSGVRLQSGQALVDWLEDEGEAAGRAET